MDDRKVLCGIWFVLHTGIRWEFLPKELGFGSGMTCWRRLAAWHEAGVWDRLHQVLLAELHAAGKLDWSRAVIANPLERPRSLATFKVPLFAEYSAQIRETILGNGAVFSETAGPLAGAGGTD